MEINFLSRYQLSLTLTCKITLPYKMVVYLLYVDFLTTYHKLKVNKQNNHIEKRLKKKESPYIFSRCFLVSHYILVTFFLFRSIVQTCLVEEEHIHNLSMQRDQLEWLHHQLLISSTTTTTRTTTSATIWS